MDLLNHPDLPAEIHMYLAGAPLTGDYATVVSDWLLPFRDDLSFLERFFEKRLYWVTMNRAAGNDPAIADRIDEEMDKSLGTSLAREAKTGPQN